MILEDDPDKKGQAARIADCEHSDRRHLSWLKELSRSGEITVKLK
jgi:flagellar motor switch protein FliG